MTATFTNAPAGRYYVKVHVPGFGYSDFGSDDTILQYIVFWLDNFTITGGATTGLVGGSTLTVTTPFGLNTVETNRNSVHVCGQNCPINTSTVTNSQI